MNISPDFDSIPIDLGQRAIVMVIVVVGAKPLDPHSKPV